MKHQTTKRLLLVTLASVPFAMLSPAAVCDDPAPTVVSLPGAKMKLSAELIWGTNEESKDPALKPVDEKIAKRLEGMAVKWKYFYSVTVKELAVAEGKTVKVEMSNDCELAVKNLDGTNVEIQLIGKGKPAGKVTKGLGKGKCLITGGDATNSTAWFVFMKQVD